MRKLGIHKNSRWTTRIDALSEAEDQALIERVAAEVQRDSGVPLDQLISPSKVINLERDLVKLRNDLELSNSMARNEILKVIEKKEKTLAIEKRSVMQDWLKQIFVGQAVLSAIIAGFMVYDAVPGFEHIDLSIRVLGFWMIWLFVIPSLRARKPTNSGEKKALNIAFLATPLASLIAPFITKDPIAIYWLNLAVCAASYGYGYLTGSSEDDSKQPEWIKFIYKALDFGSGRERGARK